MTDTEVHVNEVSDAEFEDRMFKAAAEYRNTMGGRVVKIEDSVEAMKTARAALERQRIPVLALTSLAVRMLGCASHRYDAHTLQCAIIAQARHDMRFGR